VVRLVLLVVLLVVVQAVLAIIPVVFHILARRVAYGVAVPHQGVPVSLRRYYKLICMVVLVVLARVGVEFREEVVRVTRPVQELVAQEPRERAAFLSSSYVALFL